MLNGNKVPKQHLKINPKEDFVNKKYWNVN